MFAFIWWLVIGLIAGALARLFVPGRQPMGLFMTMLLGLAGSMVGGFLASVLFGYDPRVPGLHAGGLFMSIIGAVLLLLIYVSMSNGSRWGHRWP
jgi:uncharacterized membrane protein YeaQ/YmgE (transglycosylase-associated protein family)